jgi:hypothetical protein
MLAREQPIHFVSVQAQARSYNVPIASGRGEKLSRSGRIRFASLRQSKRKQAKEGRIGSREVARGDR